MLKKRKYLPLIKSPQWNIFGWKPFFFECKKYVMRAGPQLGVAKAARAPPCTLPILGRRFIFTMT